ncbi:putative major intrinsic protein [Helianthus annuus]|uniref:Major intrinsic protein n=1 Tax=Helianthus annuus TaxID=4232 RepID=A0A251UIZ1_HELAN|nr:probable aquaporin SIP2-1 [Helianthus annuus]KAF5802411.1 putative major intrinsic protein [Helianthus annuus]KAJ0560541.1 putative major intrinsic protein [Helianthus annuus]KAJ0566906.1 putative major intrinsic protein [Helianthus annuus]KAJ0573570.1 putative major intrinsic protein [Helianthus annuus]KAJ0737932.1 putative major intrinsic protein [Helianthus annuus]
MAGIVQLLVTDTILSFMWAWATVIIRIIVQNFLGFSYYGHTAEFFKCCLSVLNMFLFAYLVKLTNGGAYNPIVVFTSAINGDFVTFLVNVGRIPFQVFGSIIGVRLILKTFPELWNGPELVINLHQGALTECLLTFVYVLITLGLDRYRHGSFFMKTWISSILKLALHILGSDLTGGCMNPAAVVGWAYALGVHATKEHIIVYWLAPMEACLFAVWIFRLLVRRSKPEKQKTN